MNLTQLLIFEITDRCNLGGEHTLCPNRSPARFAEVETRWGPMSDDVIVATARAAYLEYGFTGLIAWHYYNEPLCDAPRMFRLMDRIRAAVPQSRFLLWTNGMLMPDSVLNLAGPRQFSEFEQIIITDYGKRDLRPLLAELPNARALSARLDARLDPPSCEPHDGHCLRPFVEMIFDYYGNVHTCCLDWRGRTKLGNAMFDPFPAILRRWRVFRERVAGPRMRSEATETCLRCWRRDGARGILAVDPAIAHRAADWHAERCRPAIGLAVCFAACRTPPERLAEHFRWNGRLYEESGAGVIVVIGHDEPYPTLPGSAVAIRCPRPMPVFSIATAKNAAIRAVLDAGFGDILVTDLDVSFPPETWRRLISPSLGEARIPVYRMAADYDRRETDYVEAPRATGTIAMRSEDWRLVQYDERCVGYGAEDGLLMLDLDQAGIRTDRGGHVDHIAHQAGSDQVEPFLGGRRCDHWNRANGFNPENLRANRRLFCERILLSESL